jgi:hypothetical protein
MGWYVKCHYCGKEDKYRHPRCGCIKKAREALLLKITGSTVISSFAKEEKTPPGYVFLYTLYDKGGDVFWVRTVLENGHDEWHIDELIKEVPKTEAETAAEEEEEEEDEEEEEEEEEEEDA